MGKCNVSAFQASTHVPVYPFLKVGDDVEGVYAGA